MTLTPTHGPHQMTDTPTPADTVDPDGYVKVFHEGFNEWIGPVYGRFDGPRLGPHHFFIDVRPDHLNGGGMTHGGFLAAISDVVLGSTVAHSVDGMGATISLNCDFLSGVEAGTRLQGEATISRLTRSVAFVSGRLFTDDKTVLTANGIWKIFTRTT